MADEPSEITGDPVDGVGRSRTPAEAFQELSDVDLTFGWDGGPMVTLPMRLARAAPAMLEMLTQLEWVVNFNDRYCPICEGLKPLGYGPDHDENRGHRDNCRLAALLKEVRGA